MTDYYSRPSSVRKEARKRAIYAFIRDRIEEKGCPPSLEEVLEEVDITRWLLREYLTEMNGNTVFHYEDGKIMRYENWRRREAVYRHPFLSIMYYLYEGKYEGIYGRAERAAAVARGNEMAGAGIRDGDHLILDMFREPEDGQQALVCHNGGHCIRTVRYRKDGSVYLVTETPEPEITEVRDTDSFEVLGVVWKVVPAEKETVSEGEGA